MIFYVYRLVYYGPKSETQLSPASTVRLPFRTIVLIPDHVLVPIKRSKLTIPTDRYLFRPRHYRAFYINIYHIVSTSIDV